MEMKAGAVRVARRVPEPLRVGLRGRPPATDRVVSSRATRALEPQLVVRAPAELRERQRAGTAEAHRAAEPEPERAVLRAPARAARGTEAPARAERAARARAECR